MASRVHLIFLLFFINSLGVEAKNAELFYVKTDKQLKKDMIIARKTAAKEARIEAQRKEDIILRKQAAIEKYLDTICNAPSGNKNIEIVSFNLSPPGGGQELISDSPLRLHCGHRYGLIGRNGVGKTCLLSAICHYQIKDMPTHLRIMHVEQEVIGTESTVMETVLAADAER